MSHWDVIGHDWAVQQLQQALLHKRIGHAYLITGPEQVGRTTLAIAFARALNCLRPELDDRPCGECRSCRLISSRRHPDVRLIEPEVSGRGRASLKIDQMRELQKFLNLAAVEGRYKVVIIRRFDTANANAANAFLKTLEEPPPNVMLLLTASQADALLPTISSRCRTINLRPLPRTLIEETIQRQFNLSLDKAQLLSHLANGRFGWAVQAAQNDAILETHQDHVNLLRTILREKRVGRFALADKLARGPEGLPSLLQSWLSWWRDLTILALGQGVSESIINFDQIPELQPLADAWQPDTMVAALKQTDRALWQLERNGNPRLVIENLLLNYPFVQ